LKILVVRFSSIGDIVLTFPVVRCLKEQLPAVEIHYLTKASYGTLLNACLEVDKKHVIEHSINELIPKLKAEKYDVVIDLHNNIRTRSLSLKLGVNTYRFPKLNIAKWLLTAFKVNRLPNHHVVDRYFSAMQRLGVKNDGKNNRFHIPENEQVNVEESFGINEGNYLVAAIGAQFATKRIPINKWQEILGNLSIPIVLLGGKEDASLAQDICSLFPDKKIHNACGKYSLTGSTSIISKAEKIITNDTGLMHIAACFAVPIIAVWGNTVPDFGMYAYKPEKEVKVTNFEVDGLACRPCSKIGFQKCPKGHFNCMQMQDSKAIQQAINE